MKKKVLIVEDDKFFRFAVRKMIAWEKYGFEIIGEVVHGAAALEFLEQNPVDVVITDMSMPVMNGIELTAALQERYPEVMVIALSAYDDFEFVKESLKLGAQDYILKQDIDKQDTGAVIQKNWEKHRRNLSDKAQIRRYVHGIMENGDTSQKEKHLAELCLCDKAGYYLCRIRNLNGEWKTQTCQKDVWDKESLLEIHGSKEHVIFLSVSEDNSLKVKAEQRDMRLRSLENLLSGEAYIGGCSKWEESIQELQHAGECAHKACEYGRFFRNNKIWMWDLIEPEYEKRNRKFAVSQESVSGPCNEAQTEKLLADLTDQIRKNRPDEELIQKSYITLLEKICESQGLPLENGKSEVWREELGKAYILDEKRNLCRKYLSELFATSRQSDVPYSVRNGILFMRQNYRENLSLTDIAEHVSLNESYFSGIFKKATGKNVTEYLTELRIEKAKELIETTNYKNYEIGEHVGIPNSSYFSTVFKKQTGMTIQEYRQNYGM